jgi:Carbamoyl-phosphate synthase L chain, ATP binding domain
VAIPVWLAATATGYATAARLPREFARAGFDVSVLAPKGALVTESRHVAGVSLLPDRATPMQWLYMLAASVEKRPPRLIVPCDETTLQLMMLFVESPPEGLGRPLRQRLLVLIRESLGIPDYYRKSIDKTLLPAAAQAAGISVPSHAVISDLGRARTFAKMNGYPVVLKRPFGTSGHSVELVADDAQLTMAFQKLFSEGRASLLNETNLLIQAWVPGKVLLHAAATWKGVTIAGMTREVIMRMSMVGPSSVVRCRVEPEIQCLSEVLATHFGISGFMETKFIKLERTGEFCLIEINRLPTNGVHLGAMVGVDLCRALASALEGRVYSDRTDLFAEEEHVIAEFPQEWLRDARSSYLRAARTDTPWGEPGLLRAILRQTSAR